METDAMKTLIAAITLMLAASAAMAAAPCQNPLTLPCQKACAAMGVKFVLSMREQTLGTRVRTVHVGDTRETVEAMASAQQLARFAGLSLQYIDGMTLHDVSRAVDAYCARPRQ